jgi:hypothetical protein
VERPWSHRWGAVEHEESIMQAVAGDRLVVHSHHVGEPERVGDILEVHGTDGTPPYLVRWSDTEQEALVFPGADASVEHPADRS